MQVGFRRWVARTLSRNGLLGAINTEQNPDEMVEAGIVRFAGSQIVITRLKDAGIAAAAVSGSSTGWFRGLGTGPPVSIMVRRSDLDRARPIVDDASQGW
jgi:hypothetical protein